MKYFLIAGEASGDMLGASLMQGIQSTDPDAEFRFWGGDLMEQVFPGLVKHYRETNIMGFVEVILKLNTIRKNLQKCENQLLEFQPDLLILVDYPGFNLRMAGFAKKHGIRTCYFVAPKIWAWNEKRGKKLEKFVDLLLLIFPFEVDYFRKWKVNFSYVGNPLFDEIRQFRPNPEFRHKHSISDAPVIALLPGSRQQEIKRMLPTMVKMAGHFPNYQFIIAGAPGLTSDFYTPWLGVRIKICFGETRDVLAISEAAVVCSGTASLETAFMNVPQVCAYAAHPITYRIAKLFVKVKYASLVNLNLNEPVITELIQNDYSTERLDQELKGILLGGHKRKAMFEDYSRLQKQFVGSPAAIKAANEIRKLLA